MNINEDVLCVIYSKYYVTHVLPDLLTLSITFYIVSVVKSFECAVTSSYISSSTCVSIDAINKILNTNSNIIKKYNQLYNKTIYVHVSFCYLL